MEQYDPVQSVLARAEKYRIPVTEMCKRASVAPSTVWRWKTDGNGPSLRTIRKLDAALSQLIEEMMA